ncbi:hypothetical protein [Aeromicrobium sp. Leaf350]|uniref:hypothetical protein n=1 Tax=Aeromicrobium sp. Leaf350 TaxID=2876565 RepID=UPI001E51EA85|nr:hypothetical protein [Aeromicrobium sp. Leaf350]
MHARPLWPYATALVCLAMLVLGVVLGLVAGLASRDGRALPAGVPDPSQAVLLWDRAFKIGDCSSFQDTTTAAFRADYGQAEADYSTCDGFYEGLEEIEDGKPADFWRTYDIEIVEVSITGDTARITTEESWEYLDDGRERETSDTYTYDLVLTDGRWLIDDASFLYSGDETTV